jgi:uncharacterized protein
MMSKAQASWPQPQLDTEFYMHLRMARPGFKKIDEFPIDLGDKGKAFIVRRGCTARVICSTGPQIADVGFWNAQDPRERFWNDQTIVREGAYLKTFTRLWSNMPMYRPLVTVIEDTVQNVPTNPGSRHHTMCGGYCNPQFWYYEHGMDPYNEFVAEFNCYYNLLRAVRPFGLSPQHLHDNVNLFQKTFIDPETGGYTIETSDAKVGDYVEFYAEIDTLIAVSVCPAGSGPGDYNPRPLGVELYRTGVDPKEYTEFVPPLLPRDLR